MVKGVSRSVIEIKNTEDRYIEAAILFINPDKAGDTEQRIRSKAELFLHRLDGRIGNSAACQPRKTTGYIGLLLSFLAGALLMFGVMCLI